MSATSSQFIWQEKYRPPCVKAVLLPKSLKVFFDKIVETKKIPHMTLFSSSPGTGKTSLARAICSDCEIKDYLYINAAKDGRMDVLEKDIVQYISVNSLTDEHKVVILDEIEAAPYNFMQSLKGFIEKYSDSCSFILTTNNVAKIPAPILSRCPVQDFNMSEKVIKSEMIPLMISRLKAILEKSEKVKFDEEILKSLVEKNYPDLRKMIACLQSDFIKYGEITNAVVKDGYDHQEFYSMILNKDLIGARTYLINGGCDYMEMFSNLYREFVPLVPKPELQNVFILLIAKYSDYSSRSLDKEIPFISCLIEIVNNLKK